MSRQLRNAALQEQLHRLQESKVAASLLRLRAAAQSAGCMLGPSQYDHRLPKLQVLMVEAGDVQRAGLMLDSFPIIEVPRITKAFLEAL